MQKVRYMNLIWFFGLSLKIKKLTSPEFSLIWPGFTCFMNYNALTNKLLWLCRIKSWDEKHNLKSDVARKINKKYANETDQFRLLTVDTDYIGLLMFLMFMLKSSAIEFYLILQNKKFFIPERKRKYCQKKVEGRCESRKQFMSGHSSKRTRTRACLFKLIQRNSSKFTLPLRIYEIHLKIQLNRPWHSRSALPYR